MYIYPDKDHRIRLEVQANEQTAEYYYSYALETNYYGDKWFHSKFYILPATSQKIHVADILVDAMRYEPQFIMKLLQSHYDIAQIILGEDV